MQKVVSDPGFARAWNAWGGGSATLVHDPDGQDDSADPERAIGMARLEVHYFRHGCFFEPDQLLRDIDRIRHIPATIVQGRYDIICPVRSAFDLAAAWPGADLKIVLAGHSVMDPGIVDALVTVTDAMALRGA